MNKAARPSPAAPRAGPSVRVAGVGGHHRVVAARAFAPGELVLRFVGVVTVRASRYSVQLSPGRHLLPPPDLATDDAAADYLWRYLNHSCRPNAAVQGRTLVASRPIARGDEIAFDYETTEDAMADPFRCACGGCGGRWVRGRAAAPEPPTAEGVVSVGPSPAAGR